MNRLRDRDLARVAAALAVVAGAMTLYVAWHGTPLPGDVRVLRWVQDAPLLGRPQRLVNALGALPVHMVLVAAALLAAAFRSASGGRRERLEAVWLLVLALALRPFSSWLKQAAQGLRPAERYGVQVHGHWDSFGFPSGHVYGDVLVFGAIAILALRLAGAGPGTAIRVLALAVIVLAGPARMTVGAHWPSDVLGGYLWGAAALCLACWGARRLGRAG